jgi:hypothetical protein
LAFIDTAGVLLVKRQASFDDDFFALFVLFSKFSFPHFDDIVTFLLQESADL